MAGFILICALTGFPSLASVQLGAAISSGGLKKRAGEVYTGLGILGMGFLCDPFTYHALQSAYFIQVKNCPLQLR